MKYIKLEYPNQTIHNVIVTNFGYSTNNSIYFIEFYDLAQSARMYTLLEKNKDTYIRNPYLKIDIDDLFSNYQTIRESELPDLIKCVKSNSNIAKQNICIEAYKLNDDYYITNSICSKINIDDYNETKIINGVLCKRISIETIKKINKKETERNCYYIKIIEINNINTQENTSPIKEEEKEQNIEFVYYNDVSNNELYIPRDIYEICLDLKIISDSKPKIIDEKNCYSIKRNELEKLISSKYIGKEKMISESEKDDENTPRITKIITSPFYTVDKEDIIFAYKDKNTNKIYLNEKYITNKTSNSKQIMNKTCYEIDEKYLETIYNKKIIIVSIYLKNKEEIKEKPKDVEMKVYNFNDIKFISEDAITKYNIDTTNRKKIKISNEIKYAISIQELNTIIESAKNDNINIIIINKNITPANKQ